MKRIGIFSMICLLASVCLIGLLYAFRVKPYTAKNGFVRNRTSKAVLLKTYDLKYLSFYFAGITDNRIYLGNYAAPSRIQTFDIDLNFIDDDTLKIMEPGPYKWDKARTCVDSPYIYMQEGVTPIVFEGRLEDLQMRKTFPKAPYFTGNWNLSPNSMIVKCILGGDRQYVVGKSTQDSPYIRYNKEALTKQIDGIFCCEGNIAIDKENNAVVYTYFHRNEFIKMDTNLNIIFKRHTIDTNNIAKIKVAEIPGTHTFKFAAPPKYVNLLSCADNNKLYIISALMADNDVSDNFKKNMIVDVYSLADGNYEMTYFVPKYQRQPIRELRVKNNILYAIYDKSISKFQLNE